MEKMPIIANDPFTQKNNTYHTMKTYRLSLLLALFLIMTSCSTVKVTVDQDRNADFSTYETYSFLGWQADSDRILNDMAKKRLRDAFIKEFERRGLKPVPQNGDMEISLFIVVSRETSVSAYTDYYGGRYGGYYRYPYGWGYGFGTTTYRENHYLKGTLVMDVFDGQSKKQVWQGIVTKTVDENSRSTGSDTQKNIQSLLRKFPIRPK